MQGSKDVKKQGSRMNREKMNRLKRIDAGKTKTSKGGRHLFNL